MKHRSAIVLAYLGTVLAILDGFFKYLAITRSPDGDRLRWFFDIALHKNYGIAFDIPVPLWIIALATTAVLVWLIIYTKIMWEPNHNLSVAAILVILGAAGNLIDRIINGFATDYLIIFQTSAINLSDILIVAGVLMLLWYNKNKDSNSN